MKTNELKDVLGNADIYLIDLVQKGYFDESKQILDAGCGSGRNALFFQKLGHEVLALDQEAENMEELEMYIKEHALSNICCRVGELGALEMKKQRFDVVLCNAVLHFAKDKAHFERMFADLVAHLKPQGILFIRLVTSHTYNSVSGPFNEVKQLPDESARFVVDITWLIQVVLEKYNVNFLESLKTVNVAGLRTMTTLVLTTE